MMTKLMRSKNQVPVSMLKCALKLFILGVFSSGPFALASADDADPKLNLNIEQAIKSSTNYSEKLMPNKGLELQCYKIDGVPVFDALHCEIAAKCSQTHVAMRFGQSGGVHDTHKKLSDKDGQLYGILGGLKPVSHATTYNPAKDEGGISKRIRLHCDNMDTCQVMECLKEKQKTLPLLPYYAAAQNSNTYVHRLLRNCGCSPWPLSSITPNVVGWNIRETPLPKKIPAFQFVLKEFSDQELTDADQGP